MMTGNDKNFVLCIENAGFEVSLEIRKVYRRLSSPSVTDESLVRVVDESGEDYLYPAEYFVPIILPKAATSAFEEATA